MAIPIKVNGQIIVLMEKGYILKLLKLEDNLNKIFILASFHRVIITGKELWSMQMEINMKAYGLLVKNKAKECIIGSMVIIMMEIGKKIRQKELALLVLEENFMMVNFI